MYMYMYICIYICRERERCIYIYIMELCWWRALAEDSGGPRGGSRAARPASQKVDHSRL